MSARRIQRKRTAGWKAPKGAVYVGRAGGLNCWGNPFIVGDLLNGGNISPQEAVDLHRKALLEGRLQYSVAKVRRELAGKTLMCWCKVGDPCHADTLLEVAAGKDLR